MRFFKLFRSLFFLSVLSFWAGSATVSQAQNTPVFGNEWINYAQPYYKIKVVTTGMHRLTYNDLAAAGISNVDPQKFQVFRRGREVAIFVNGQADGVLNSGDYIDFYGERNDGTLDSTLYRNHDFQISKAYSLFTDTAAYYLTWGTANGKRMQERTSQTAGLTPEPRHYAERFRKFNDQYFAGYQVGSTHGALGESGEGFTGPQFNRSRKDTLRGLQNIESGGRNPVLEVGVQSSNAAAAQLKILIKPPGAPERVLTNATTGASGVLSFPAFNFRRAKFNIQHSDIHPNGVVYIRTANTDSASTTVRQTRISYYKLTYSRTNDLGGNGKLILTDSTKTTPSYFQFANAPANVIAYDISDPYNIIRTTGTTVGSDMGFVFDPATFTRRILVVNSQNTLNPAAIRSIQFAQITNPSQYDFVIITHPLLRQPVAGTSYTDPPADYAAYRASTAGGNYNPVVVNIDQVYEQFHYGEKSAVAIRNFMRWFEANANPKFLLLIGKGLEIGVGTTSGDIRKRPDYYKSRGEGEDLVPTFGYPASDVLFTAEYRKNSYAPTVATGRIPAQTGADVISYLKKVEEHELLGLEEWRKNVLHLGGGVSANEQNQFRRYLENYENKIEGPLLGAKVKSITRFTTGTPIVSLNVKDEINAGMSLITFFGHSSSSTSDLDIGYVSDPTYGYFNKGKYNMILMNGCGAGNSFQLKNVYNRFSFSEDWLLTPDKGSVLFLASIANSVPFALNNYSNNFYSVAFSDSAYYGKPVGEIQQEVIRRAVSTSPNNWDNLVVASEMVLQGDPAIRLFAPEKPDYTFQAKDLALQAINKGSVVTASDEKFNLLINAKNLGKAIEDSLWITVKRTLPSGSLVTYGPVKFAPLFNETTYTFEINSKGVQGFGNNRFEVILDPDNKVDELNETNNSAILNQYLSVNGVIALLPAEYSIVSTTSVKLTGQPADILSKPRDYYFELDTVKSFDSPFKKSSIVRNAASLASWRVNLFNGAPQDSTVFFWRLRFNDFKAGEDTIWSESSFRYINNSQPGWSQSHYRQFDKAQKDNIRLDSVSRKWEFGPIYKSLSLRTMGGNNQFVYPFGIYLDNNMTFYFCHDYTAPLITVGVYDNRKLDTWMGYPTNKCGWPETFYKFDLSSQAGINQFVGFINAVPDGYYVGILSGNSVPFTTMTAAQKDAFRKIGSTMIDTLKTGYPFALVGQKGATVGQGKLLQEMTYDPNSATPALDQGIKLDVLLEGHQPEGKITSTKIGPAAQWTSLHHTVKTSGMDEYTLDLYGFDLQGNRSLIQSDIQSKSYSLAGVSAVDFPYLQLEMAKADTSDRTAPQLEQWLVVYQPVPEGIIRPDLVGLEKYEDVSKQAAAGKVKLRFAFSNISELPFSDSLTVVRSVNGSRVTLQDTIRVQRLLAGDSVFFDYEFSTAGMKGNNAVRVDVNPYLLPEQYYFNNFLEIPFTMPHADLHPVLDVVFDGIHIMDGDLVSPSPKIAINLKDEDKYDYVTDPNKLEVFISKPDDLTNYERIDMTDQSLVTLPNLSGSTTDKRDFNITYHPKGLADGLYSLRVQGRDNSNNEAGFQPYTISFRVVNESSITHFYPYPNPFSSHTRFVFTLTGNPENMPRNLKIQIMTLTGKVVREIQKEELGPIHVGNNQSLPWDGTDEYGDKLANGAYLYRVVMEKSPFEEMKHRKTSADKSFKKEYGKLYILR